jgi:hypothetical protein
MNSLLYRLCQSDMGTMCANFLKIIAKELVNDGFTLNVRQQLVIALIAIIHHWDLTSFAF